MRKHTASVVQELARTILTVESGRSGDSETQTDAVLRTFEKLRLHLSRLVGPAGFQALLSRARGLAVAEVRWLKSVQVKADGTLEGFGEIMQQQEAEAVTEGSAVFLGLLLGLLVTFIGEDLTLRLVQDVWPDAALNNMASDAEETAE